MNQNQRLLDVDLKGLRDLIEDAGPGRLVCELIRNSLDETGVTTVDISIEPVPGRSLISVRIADDAPQGFHDLSHAYTLFAPSYKKVHPEKAGRFNLCDKLFLAAAVLTGCPVEIATTSGTITFDKTGRSRK